MNRRLAPASDVCATGLTWINSAAPNDYTFEPVSAAGRTEMIDVGVRDDDRVRNVGQLIARVVDHHAVRSRIYAVTG